MKREGDRVPVWRRNVAHEGAAWAGGRTRVRKGQGEESVVDRGSIECNVRKDVAQEVPPTTVSQGVSSARRTWKRSSVRGVWDRMQAQEATYLGLGGGRGALRPSGAGLGRQQQLLWYLLLLAPGGEAPGPGPGRPPGAPQRACGPWCPPPGRRIAACGVLHGLRRAEGAAAVSGALKRPGWRAGCRWAGGGCAGRMGRLGRLGR